MPENSKLSPKAQFLLHVALQHAERYFYSTNQILGVLGFTFAYACTGINNTKFYGMIAAVFILFLWIASFWKYRLHLKMLRKSGMRRMQFWPVMRRSMLGMMGWLVLVFVATGYLTKNGFDIHPERHPIYFYVSADHS